MLASKNFLERVIEMVPSFIASFAPQSYVMLEGAVTGGMSDSQATALTSSLQTFGNTILDNFIKLLPAIAVLAAIMFIIRLVKRKVK